MRKLTVLVAIVVFGLSIFGSAYANPVITATKSDALVNDNNGNNLADPGDGLLYRTFVT